MPLLEIGEIVLRGDDIRDHPAVPDRVSAHLDLSFVQVPLSIPFTGKIVLVFPPGDTGHELSGVPPFLPGSEPVLEGQAAPVPVRGIAAYAVYHDGIGPVVDMFAPGPGGLESSFVRRMLGSTGSTGYCQNETGQVYNRVLVHFVKIIKREDEIWQLHPPSSPI